jgi:hypothetical protein
LFLVFGLTFLAISYQFSGLEIDVVSFKTPTTKSFGAITGLGILLTLSAGLLLGFFFYLAELIRIRTRFKVIKEIRQRRIRDQEK